ncbi:MAG TPA: hypothetical protein VFJ51_02805 [Nitrososphaeraceae archaeon]|nr:hypothetical protein [Nitrososphaeraceae archaeon]
MVFNIRIHCRHIHGIPGYHLLYVYFQYPTFQYPTYNMTAVYNIALNVTKNSALTGKPAGTGLLP